MSEQQENKDLSYLREQGVRKLGVRWLYSIRETRDPSIMFPARDRGGRRVRDRELHGGGEGHGRLMVSVEHWRNGWTKN